MFPFWVIWLFPISIIPPRKGGRASGKMRRKLARQRKEKAALFAKGSITYESSMSSHSNSRSKPQRTRICQMKGGKAKNGGVLKGAASQVDWWVCSIVVTELGWVGGRSGSALSPP